MRKGMLVAATAVLAALAVILPGLAASETSPTITAVNGPGVPPQHSWSPSAVSVGEGASVTLSNPTAVPHGVEWVSVPATPVCSGVPVGTTEAASGTQWSGNCTFTRAGTYSFYCTVHGAAMSGTITVSAAAGEPPVTTTTTTTTTLPPGSGSGGNTNGGTGSGGGGGGAGQPGTTGAGGAPQGAGSPFAGGAAQALKLKASQRAEAVHGSLAISAAGAHGGLEIDLLSSAASLARREHAVAVRVGKLERGSLAAGTVRFAVALDARAKRALARRGQLALTVEITLTPPGGRAARLERGVVLRRPSR
jgi:plastocyanin